MAASRELSQSLKLEDLLDAICRIARDLLGADGATFVLREGMVVHYAAENAMGPLWKGQRFPIEQCISGWAVLERATAVVGDILTDPRIPQEAYRRRSSGAS
jgi:GAF domain-containing protein